MRYYNFEIYANADEIRENADIRLNDYAFGNTLASVNNYIYNKKINDVDFFIYRDNGDILSAVISYNEKKVSFADAYSNILEMLKDVFHIKGIKAMPTEITMRQFFDNLTEGRRREFTNRSKVTTTFGDWIWEIYNWRIDEAKNKFYFSEILADEDYTLSEGIYDEAFVEELKNIEDHRNTSKKGANMVHYVISTKSEEATADMTKALASKLLKSKRISGKRIGLISKLDPGIYRASNSYLEDIIENNFGGIIIFDLTPRFGYSAENYTGTAEYIEQLFKKYRNDCLFVFTYNKDNPGFAYYLLPNLKKYAIPMMLKEGEGDRKAAVSYLESLIKHSEYSEYAKQAGIFLKKYPGDEFTQTDVLMAYQQFEPWCINENILKAYNYDFSEDFMLDRDEGVSSYEKLHNMIGLDIVKKQIDDILASAVIEKERKKRKGKKYEQGTMHMVFAGNPGTAKTTVARLFAGIGKEKGLLKSGAFVECGGMDLDGYVEGIRRVFTAAKGGVLFIDEAYALGLPSSIATLIQEMENHRDDVIVILAGYNERMERFMKRNEGLKSRIPYWVDFPDYTSEELTDIFKFIIDERSLTAGEDVIKEARYNLEKARYIEDFGNGRYVRNMVDRAAQNQAVRLMSAKGDPAKVKDKALYSLIKEDITMVNEGLVKERKPGVAKKELAEMIGLDAAKSVIKKAVASYKMNKLCLEKGMSKEKLAMHMVFTGNPGTAKTTVARLLGEIFRDEKILPTGKFIEVGRADLIGTHVGETAPLVVDAFKRARGGVLFIDEAYSLCDSLKGGYGDEAISTIVQEMENHRDDVIVIFAGYPGPMQEFLERNPGMKSRIAFHVSFDDYTVEELCDITKLMVKNKGMKITKAAIEKLKKSYENVHSEGDYGNGRFVRKMLEEAEMNIATRLFDEGESEITDELIKCIEECDIPEIAESKKIVKRIGFAS